jgi:hypothetical protein
MDDNDQDLIADIVYNKLYSHKEIEKLADYIGEDIWSQHYIYLEDFLMCFAVAWTTERFMRIEYGGVYHRYGNPQGMTSGVYEMDGKKLKNPQYTDKRLGDLLSMWEKIFDLTENELDGEYFRVKLILSLKHFKGINTFKSTYHYERIINLCKRMYNWKYASDYGKNIAKEFALELIDFEISIKEKYDEFYDSNYDYGYDNDVKNKVKKNEKSKKEKKKKNKKFEENENKMKKKEEKKREKKKEKKDNIIKDIDQIDGFIEGVEDL